MQAKLVSTKPEATPGDAIVVPLFQGNRTLDRGLSGLDRKLGGALSAALRRPGAGKFMETTLLQGGRGGPAAVLTIGLGRQGELDLVRLRNALQQAGRALRRHGSRRVA
ncbi:MAG TPA: M17 family peptidase N-terminal domain-containing protein, partial [Candidatus Limnocylindrales bacterium]|nr:M17 family peptidase N-terminal domain-containing protein [Candidatus Limnocylindrales bacterium]